MARSLHVRSITPGKMVGGRFVANPSGKMKLGRGGRFKKLESEIAARGGAYDPQAVAAAIGMRKYGKKRMESWGAARKARNRNPEEAIAQVQYRSEALRIAKDWREKGYKTKVKRGLYGTYTVYIRRATTKSNRRRRRK